MISFIHEYLQLSFPDIYASWIYMMQTNPNVLHAKCVDLPILPETNSIYWQFLLFLGWIRRSAITS